MNQRGFVFIFFLIGAAVGCVCAQAAHRAHLTRMRFESSEHFVSVGK